MVFVSWVNAAVRPPWCPSREEDGEDEPSYHVSSSPPVLCQFERDPPSRCVIGCLGGRSEGLGRIGVGMFRDSSSVSVLSVGDLCTRRPSRPSPIIRCGRGPPCPRSVCPSSVNDTVGGVGVLGTRVPEGPESRGQTLTNRDVCLFVRKSVSLSCSGPDPYRRTI